MNYLQHDAHYIIYLKHLKEQSTEEKQKGDEPGLFCDANY